MSIIWDTDHTPAMTGTHNVEPSLVTADGKIYCYDDARYQAGSAFLLQLIDDNHLRAEVQPGTCPANPQFVKPVVYER